MPPALRLDEASKYFEQCSCQKVSLHHRMKQSVLGCNGGSNSRQRKVAITFLPGAPIILLLKNAQEHAGRNTRLARPAADSLSNASH